MVFQMIRIEQQKLLQRRLFWIELGVLALAVVLLFGALIFAKAQVESGNANGEEGGLVIEVDSPGEIEEQLFWPYGVINSFAVTSLLGVYLLIILVGAIVSQEYAWRTVSLWLSRGVSRPLFLLSKFTAVFITAFFFVLTAVSLGTLISGGFSLALQGTLPFESTNWSIVGLNLLTTSLGLLPYAAMTLFLAHISRSAVAAIGGGLVFVTLLEPLLGQVLQFWNASWTQIGNYFPSSLTRQLGLWVSQINIDAAPLTVPDGMPSMGTAVFASLLYIILFTGASLLVFQRQDLGG